jgi:GNAT superfamily N-acetyltransferase
MEQPFPVAERIEGVQIRAARLDDRDFVVNLMPQLHDSGAPPWRNAPHMTEFDIRVIADALAGNSPGACVLIAENELQQPVGFIHLCEEEDYYDGACGHVGDVVVARQERGRGIGRALLAAGEQWARARGYRLLTLNVFLGNERAQELYVELGFNPETIRHVKVLG